MGKYHPSHHVNEWIRYILYGFNFILWIVAIFLLLVGLFGIAIREDNLNINSHISFLTDPAAILVAIGAVVFVVTFFGCVGALNENCLFLRIYFILLIIIFVVEIVCGILTFAFSQQLTEKVDEVIQDGIRQYRADADLTNFIDFAQRELECCGGLDAYRDWNANRYFNCSDDNKSVERCAVPYSCCLDSDEEVINTMCGFQVQKQLPVQASERIYITGCIDKFVQQAKARSLLLGLAVFGVALLQLLGIFMAFELNRELNLERKMYSGHSDLPK